MFNRGKPAQPRSHRFWHHCRFCKWLPTPPRRCTQTDHYLDTILNANLYLDAVTATSAYQYTAAVEYTTANSHTAANLHPYHHLDADDHSVSNRYAGPFSNSSAYQHTYTI